MVCIAIAYFNIFSENGFNIFVKVNAWRSVAFVFVNTIINTIKNFVLSWCMKPRNQRHVSDETQSKQNQRNSCEVVWKWLTLLITACIQIKFTWLTWPWSRARLLVSFSFPNTISCFIQWAPELGESGCR